MISSPIIFNYSLMFTISRPVHVGISKILIDARNDERDKMVEIIVLKGLLCADARQWCNSGQGRTI
jgi:hypothetical protein